MQKTLLLFAAATMVALASCTKNDGTASTSPTTSTSTGTSTGTTTTTTGQSSFVIDNIHDVSVDSSDGSNVLPIAVNRVANSTTQETVTLSAPNLPAGFSASFSPASGTVAFASAVTFSYDYSGNGGTFPAKIMGTSASGTKTYTLNLSAPTLSNGWMLGSDKYTMNALTSSNAPASTGNMQATASNPAGELVLQLTYQQLLPTSTTTLKVVNNPVNPGEVALHLTDKNHIQYNTTGVGASTGTITVQNGKYGFRCNNVEMSTSNGSVTKRFSCRISQ